MRNDRFDNFNRQRDIPEINSRLYPTADLDEGAFGSDWLQRRSALRFLSTIAFAALAIVFPYCWGAWAGPCQKSLSPDPIAERDGYKERGGGQRCEGFYTSPAAGESVEIVSLS